MQVLFTFACLSKESASVTLCAVFQSCCWWPTALTGLCLSSGVGYVVYELVKAAFPQKK